MKKEKVINLKEKIINISNEIINNVINVNEDDKRSIDHIKRIIERFKDDSNTIDSIIYYHEELIVFFHELLVHLKITYSNYIKICFVVFDIINLINN